MRTFRTIGIIGTAAALLLSASVAFAQDRPVTATTTQGKISQTAQERMQAVRIQAQTRMATQREKVAQRLTAIQDKAKQQMAERLSRQFDTLNRTWTDRFMQTLDAYTAILVRIQNRATVAATKGKDVTATNNMIQLAKTAIEGARLAVTLQAAKTYVPTSTTSSNEQTKLMQSLRDSFKTLHESLFKDLFALRDGSMTSSRRTVQNALQTLGQIPGVDEGEMTATSTLNQ